MNIFSLIPFTGNSELQKYFSNRNALNPGDKLQGQVIDIKKNGKVLVDFGRFRALAQIHFPVVKGEVLRLHVVEKNKELRLSIDKLKKKTDPHKKGTHVQLFSPGRTNRLQRDIRSITQKNLLTPPGKKLPDSIKTALSTIESFFKPFNPENPSQTGLKLKGHIEHSGLFFEKKIEALIHPPSKEPPIDARIESSFQQKTESIFKDDLKPNLIKVKSYLADHGTNAGPPGREQAQALIRSIDQMLSDITYQQDLAVARHYKPKSLQQPSFSDTLEKKMEIDGLRSQVEKNIRFLTASFKRIVDHRAVKKTKPLLEKLNTFLQAAKSVIDHRKMPSHGINRIGLKETAASLSMVKSFFADQSDINLLYRLFDLKTLEALKTAMGTLETDLTAYQEKQAEKPAGGNDYQSFIYDLPLDETDRKARLKIHYPKKGKKRSDGDVKISLLLDMERLGNVRTDLFLYKADGLNVTFFVRDNRIKTLFEKNIQEVQQNLSPLFNGIIVQVGTAEDKIDQFDREERETVIDGKGKVDITI